MTDKLDRLIQDFKAVASDPQNIKGRLAALEAEKKALAQAEWDKTRRESVKDLAYDTVI